MQTGPLSPDTFSQALRGLSQKRKHGSLEIHYPDRLVKILFIQGKIVDFIDEKASANQEITALFSAAGLITGNINLSVGSYRELFTQITSHAVPGVIIGEDLFRRALKQRVLHRLYTLELKTGAYFAFTAQMIEGADRDLLASISAGSLLLDFVALEADGPRFRELCPDLATVSVLVEDLGALADDERLVVDAIRAGFSSVSQIRARTMLSEFPLQDALLGMLDRKLVAVSQGKAVEKNPVALAPPTAAASAAATASSQSELDDLVATLEGPLDSAIDKIFENELGLAEDEMPAAMKSETEIAPAPEPELPAAAPRAEPVISKRPQPEAVPERKSPILETAHATTATNKPPVVGEVSLLQKPWVIHLTLFVFACALLTAPFIFWRGIGIE